MIDTAPSQKLSTADRAKLSAGKSSQPIYNAVSRVLAARHTGGGTLLDVGCGHGELWQHVASQFDHYCGADVIHYAGFPKESTFYQVDLETGKVDLPDGFADVVASVETIEHLENPRAFVRELTRLVKPGGLIVVTTPNQLSFLSKLTLVLRNEFNAFRSTSYPAHITALLEVDLLRIASESGWQDVKIAYTCTGRIPGVAWHWPSWVSRIQPRALSDNVLASGLKNA